jgi:alpha-glucosidase (family GH31 glycosyl hydrolase)
VFILMLRPVFKEIPRYRKLDLFYVSLGAVDFIISSNLESVSETSLRVHHHQIDFFVIPFHLQPLPVHSANCVKLMQ